MSKTIRNISYVTIGVSLAQVLISFRSFFLARLIDPSDFGIWTAALTIISLAPILSLGTVETLLKQVPYYRGKEDNDGLRRVEDSVFATIVLSTATLALLFLACGRIFPFAFIRANLLVSQIIAISAAVGFFTSYHYYRCMAYENFGLVSVFDSVRAGTNCLFILLFSWEWGLLGAAAGFLVSEILNWIVIGYLCSRVHGNVHACYRLSFMAETVRIGFPITLTWWIYAIHASVGRMTSISFLGNNPTGYFGVASSFAMLFALVPNLIARVFYPRINAQVGANAELGSLRESVVTPTTAITLLLPLVQAVAFFLLPFLLTHFLPKYMEGLLCAQILTIGAFFVGMIRNGANYLIAVDMQMRLLKYVVISVIANAMGSVLLVQLGWGINGIAIAGSLASALLTGLIWQRVLIQLKYDKKSRFGLYASFYAPLASIVLAIVALRFGFSFIGGGSVFLLSLQISLVMVIWATTVWLLPVTRLQILNLYGCLISRFLASRVKLPVTE